MSFKPPTTPTPAAAAAANPPQFSAVPSPSPASGTMDQAGESTPSPSPSPLDKPLAKLTEEDIAQLTREDCRRFLKAKGMRRPSWNKSQAIQQVVSLKALLEGRPGCDDSPVAPGVLRKPPLLPPLPPPPQSSSPVPANPPQATVASPGTVPAESTKSPSPSLAKDPSPYRRRDPMPPPSVAGEATCRAPIAGKDRFPPENRCLSPRPTAEAEAPAGQMTIFYDGKISVYNDVTAEQARLIMELAASTVCFDAPAGPLCPPSRPPIPRSPPAFLLPGSPPAPTASPLSGNFRASASGGRWGHQHVASGGEMEWRVSRETEHEGPVSRKACLQRYLEKRKDRFKGKRILVGSGSTNVEAIFSSQNIVFQNLSEHSKQTVSCSSLPPPPGTPTKYSSMDSRTQKERISIDLNDDGGEN